MPVSNVNRFSRRAAVGVTLGAMAGMGLVATGSAQGTPIATPAAGLRTVTDYLGRAVEIPVAPQRVITLSLPILEIALAVGIKPVGSASFATLGGFPSYFGDRADGIELVGDGEFDFEKILSLKPDLAIMDYFGEQDSETLATMEQIVPIVTVGEFRSNWREDSTQVAEFLNRREEFRPIEETYDTRIAEIKQGLAQIWTGKHVALLRFRASDIRIMKQISFAGNVLEDIGLLFPDIPDSGTGVAEDFSLEQAKLIDVDALFVVHDSGDEALNNLTIYMSNAVVQSLNVVKSGHVYPVDQEVWITLRGYGASEIILDDVEKYLINGEPPVALPTV